MSSENIEAGGEKRKPEKPDATAASPPEALDPLAELLARAKDVELPKLEPEPNGPAQDEPAPPQDEPSPAEPAAPRFSDEALALIFAERHAAGFRYVALWAKWLKWNGSYWRTETTLYAFDLARRISRDEAATTSGKTAKDLASARTVAATERLAKADRRLAATDEQWDADSYAFNPLTKGER